MFGKPTKCEFLLKAFPIWQPVTDFWRKATNWPVLGKYARWLHNEKHYDVTFIPINQEIEKDESMVLPKQVVSEIIQQSCHRVIMKVCLCRVACGCNSYPLEYGCLFLGESAKGIDPSMGRAVSVEEAEEYMDKCIEAGLIPQIGRVDADPFMLGLKDWDRFLTLCFCCTCCCVAMRKWSQWSPKVKERMHKLPGLKVKVNEECTGCKKCIESCFTSAISIEGGRARISEDCRGCGVCADACPADAIDIIIDDGELMLEEALKRIRRHADVT